jgi:thiamine kinase-like enzyme
VIADALRALEPQLGPPESEPVPIEGGITNRNYRVRFVGRDCVVRLPGKDTELLGIDREAEREAATIAHAAGLGPAVSAFLVEDNCLVTAFVDGHGLEAADVREDIDRVAAALYAIHHAHAAVHHTFSPFETGRLYREVTLERGGALPQDFDEAFAAAKRIEAALPRFKPALCHNDLLPANLLDDGERLWLIDWEYAGMGDPFFDLGNLSAMNGFEVHDDTELLMAYLGHCDEPDLARLRLHRAAAQYREGMWGVVQQVLSDIDHDFAAYADDWLGEMLESDWEEWLDGAAA